METKKWVISVCGLNCAKCDIYIASHGNEQIRNEIVVRFPKEKTEVINPENIRCNGCRGSLEAHWSSGCKMMLCARKRGLKYCFQCEGFPCTIVNEFCANGIAHHRRSIENLKRIKQIGLEAWIKAQKRNGQCVFCP